MKYILAMVVSLLSLMATTMINVSSVSASKTCPPSGQSCDDSAPISYNYTNSRLELMPQCFPFVWMNDFFAGNLSGMYKNQEECIAKRLLDFKQ